MYNEGCFFSEGLANDSFVQWWFTQKGNRKNIIYTLFQSYTKEKF